MRPPDEELAAMLAAADEDDAGDGDEPGDVGARKLVDPRTLPARFHHLRAAGQCGALCLHAFQGSDKDTLATRLGSGTHAKLLGKPHVVWAQAAAKSKTPGKIAPRNGKAWDAFRAAHPGHVIMTPKEDTAAEAMASAILNDSHAAPALLGPGVVYERQIIWTQLGRQRRSTPDVVGDRQGDRWISEVKTTRSAEPWWFARDAKRMAYHAQLVDQAGAVMHERGWRTMPRLLIVAVESRPPHVVQVYQLTRKTIADAEMLLSSWLTRLQMYEATDRWGAYSPGVVDLEFEEQHAAPAAYVEPAEEER